MLSHAERSGLFFPLPGRISASGIIEKTTISQLRDSTGLSPVSLFTLFSPALNMNLLIL